MSIMCGVDRAGNPIRSRAHRLGMERGMSDQDSTGFVSCVYFIRFGECGPIKIGKCSGSLAIRLSSLQVGSPERLRLMGIIEDPSEVFSEDYLHAKFLHLWIRGEWFHSTRELTDFVAANATPVKIEQDWLDVADQLFYDDNIWSDKEFALGGNTVENLWKTHHMKV
jgi:hypothetical protein